MESLLERGEKLDDLVAKSEHLGNQSKAFYKTVSMKQNCQRWAKAHWAVRSDCTPVCPRSTRRHGNRTPAAKSCDATTSSLWTRLSMPFCSSYNSHHASSSWISGYKVFSGSGRDLLQEGVEGGIEVWPLQIAVNWGGVKEAMGLFRGRSDICIIFKLYKCKHLCGVWTPAQDIWHCVLVMSVEAT